MKKNKPAQRYRWEARPPLTRPDLFEECWEFADFWAENDEKAVERMAKMFERYNVGLQTIKVSCGERMIRTFRTIGGVDPSR